jgi:hypothetical protein
MKPPPARDPPPVPVVSVSAVVVLLVDVVSRESDFTLLDRTASSGASVAGAVAVCEQAASTASAATRNTLRRTIVLLLSFSVKW